MPLSAFELPYGNNMRRLLHLIRRRTNVNPGSGEESTMRMMSFHLTTPQIRSRVKTVTVRVGWRFLKPHQPSVPSSRAKG